MAKGGYHATLAVWRTMQQRELVQIAWSELDGKDFEGSELYSMDAHPAECIGQDFEWEAVGG